MPSFYSFTSKFYLVVICAGLFLDVLYAFAANVKYRYSRSPRWVRLPTYNLRFRTNVLLKIHILGDGFGLDSFAGHLSDGPSSGALRR